MSQNPLLRTDLNFSIGSPRLIGRQDILGSVFPVTMMNPFVQHGAFSWSELVTPTPEAVIPFYQQLFDWKIATDDTMPAYFTIEADGQMIGGIMNTKDNPTLSSMPAIWGVYVTVKDVDATIGQVESLGGKVLMAPQNIPTVGRMAVISDPNGATISIISYESAAA